MHALATPDFIAALPKAELHLHIEGTLEPELMFRLAARNRLTLPFADVAALRSAYQFSDLQSFLDIYYQGMAVLLTADDFYDLTRAYLQRCAADRVVHCEIFCDPQAHMARGVGLDMMFAGITAALAEGRREFGITALLIPCFLRNLGAASAMDTLLAMVPYLDCICGVGLDSSERGYPPRLFAEVFARARAMGLNTVAHAGEEGPPDYIVEAVDLLRVKRIDHGVRVTESALLAGRLRDLTLPLTVCPLSNVRLKVYADMADHPILKLLEQGLRVTVNSDDPAYFGGYMNANFQVLSDSLGLTRAQALKLAANSFAGSFLPQADKLHWLEQLRQLAHHTVAMPAGGAVTAPPAAPSRADR